ncbi:prepilin-type N-terminal cleavage/methylation domain-containing protein [Acidovorax sp.]|uniref:prepilin-type N-terminal cleavage/methylation domain-containing protein n=1 Tax=Acidovorax sp. TaxID=1872122 RepID=UPI0025BFAA90|nr:prepilin-type N-terminal cleavage/methylation domain-containing protein [Acidovorax sp.]
MTALSICAPVLGASRAQAGFSMVEVSLALVVAGLMSWAAFSGYETVSAQQDIERGRAEALQLQTTLRAFALRNARLPCPDASSTGDGGYESQTAGVCSAGNQVGWFPYVSVGLERPAPGLRARYAVFRSSAAPDADLAVATERTLDTAGDATFRDANDLVAGLNNASRMATDTARPYLTGDGGAAGAIDCAGNAVMPVAYWVVIPLKDRDDNGDRLDPPHTAASPCAASPSAPVRFGTDDVVVAESPAQLAGWLRRSLP